MASLVLGVSTPQSHAQTRSENLLGKDGLIIGFGLGGALVSTTLKTVTATTTPITIRQSESSLALAGDFRLGAGIGEKVMLFWFGKSAFYNGPGSFGVATQTSTILGAGGIGASYRLTPRLALGGGVGFASLTYNRQTEWGPGFEVTAEYEVARHWVVGADAVLGYPKPEPLPGAEKDVTSLAVRLTFGWLYY